MARPVVLVDAYSSAKRLPEQFAAAGHECVHVQSMPRIPDVYAATFFRDRFAANVVHDGDLEATLRAVEALAPAALIAGSEPGVELADELSERLGLRSNGTALSVTRRDKHRMAERVRAEGLPVADQIVTSSETELANWVRAQEGRVVVKPLRSAGNDGVSFCEDAAAAVTALRSLVGSASALATDNAAVLAQAYLPGCEYYINTVSLDGQHHLCDIWKTAHLSLNGVLDLLEGSWLLPARGEVQDELVPYAFRVLDALGIRHGPAHTELKLTPDGPRLIEAGARLCGGDIPYLARQAIGESQLDWTVDAFVQPERFRRRCDEPYTVRRFAALKGMISPVEGTLLSYRGLDRIKELESFNSAWFLVRPGEAIVRTVNDFTYAMGVTFLHEVEEFVQRDFATARYLDGPAFYEVEPHATPTARAGSR